MREYKFRGMDFNKATWRYGTYYFGVMYPNSFAAHYIGDCQVDPETIGQFTGIQKNKNEVYEGDKTADGVIEFNVDTCCYIIRRPNGTFIRLDVKKDKLEIIGNIYETTLKHETSK